MNNFSYDFDILECYAVWGKGINILQEIVVPIFSVDWDNLFLLKFCNYLPNYTAFIVNSLQY